MGVAPSTANHRSFFNARTRKSANAGDWSSSGRDNRAHCRSIRRRLAESENRSMETRHDGIMYVRARQIGARADIVTRWPIDSPMGFVNSEISQPSAVVPRMQMKFCIFMEATCNRHVHARSYSSQRSSDLFKSSFCLTVVDTEDVGRSNWRDWYLNESSVRSLHLCFARNLQRVCKFLIQSELPMDFEHSKSVPIWRVLQMFVVIERGEVDLGNLDPSRDSGCLTSVYKPWNRSSFEAGCFNPSYKERDLDDPRLTQIRGCIYLVVSSISDRAAAKMKAFDSSREREREKRSRKIARWTILLGIHFAICFPTWAADTFLIQNVSLLSRHEIGQRFSRMRYNFR